MRIELDEQMFKVNLPSNEKDYETANGEGIWAFACTYEDLDKVMDDSYHGRAFVVALNDSFYYPGLINYEDVLEVQCNGNKRPTITLEKIKELSKLTDPEENKNSIMGWCKNGNY